MDYTWEYEEDLRLCYSKVKSYCDQQVPKIKTKLVARGGASRSTARSSSNYENWVTGASTSNSARSLRLPPGNTLCSLISVILISPGAGALAPTTGETVAMLVPLLDARSWLAELAPAAELVRDGARSGERDRLVSAEAATGE